MICIRLHLTTFTHKAASRVGRHTVLPLLLLLTALSAGPSDAGEAIRGPVERISDGDTLRVAGVKIRLWGIDAPEKAQQCQGGDGATYMCGEKSTMALTALIGGRPVECSHRDTDRYGRVVAQCSVAGADLGAMMVAAGQAVAYTRFTDHYAAQQGKAQQQAVGLWAGRFEMPWDWRRANR